MSIPVSYKCSVSDLSARLGLKLIGEDVEIVGLCSLFKPKPGHLTFFADNSDVPSINKLRLPVGLIVISKAPITGVVTLLSENPAYDFVRAVRALIDRTYFFEAIDQTQPIHPSAIVDLNSVKIGINCFIGPQAVISNDCILGPNCYIGPNVKIGARTVLQPGVIVLRNCTIGQDCFIGAGTVIGSEGFGYVKGPEGLVKFPQLGRVIVGNNVEIGANVTIDRGALDDTIVRDGVKIDNLVQIGHNVEIGESTVICGQVGIAGSSRIGRGCVLGGQVGIADHVTVADGVRIGGKAGVDSNITRPGDYLGHFGATESRTWRRFVAFLRLEFKKKIENRKTKQAGKT